MAVQLTVVAAILHHVGGSHDCDGVLARVMEAMEIGGRGRRILE